MDIRRRLRRLAEVCSRSHPRASTTNVPDGQQWASAGDTADDRGEVDSDESTGGWLATESRSQSEVLGTILILGLSMTAIGIALAAGGVALGDLISDAEASNVENGMSHLSSKASLVALGDADTQRFSLGTTQEGTVTVQPDAGTMNITRVTNESRETVSSTKLGALVYEGKNREVAYQGGGIWTKRGENSTMTSPPEFHYRGTTLTLPIIQISGDGAVGGQARGQITPVNVATNAVQGVPNPLEEGVIEIEIQSEYYEGWYQFLSQRTDGEVIMYHNNNTVVSKLTVPDEVTFQNALLIGSNRDGNIGNNIIHPENSFDNNVALRSARPLIADEIEKANDTNDNDNANCISETGIDGDCTITSGTYFIDQDTTLDGHLDIDTSDGNVTIAVDGNFDIAKNNITVTDTSTGNGVSYYINGSLRDSSNGGYVGTDNPEPESDRNVFYVANDFLDTSSGSGNLLFEAIIYAPDANDVDLAGTGDITGALAVNSVDKIQGDMNITYDSDLEETVIDITGAADLITYLHVSHNEIRVELN